MARDGERAGGGSSVGLYLLFCSQSEPGTCPSPFRFPSPCHTSGSASRAPVKRAALHVVFPHMGSRSHIVCPPVRDLSRVRSLNASQGKHIYCLHRTEMSSHESPPPRHMLAPSKSISWLRFQRHTPQICTPVNL